MPSSKILLANPIEIDVPLLAKHLGLNWWIEPAEPGTDLVCYHINDKKGQQLLSFYTRDTDNKNRDHEKSPAKPGNIVCTMIASDYSAKQLNAFISECPQQFQPFLKGILRGTPLARVDTLPQFPNRNIYVHDKEMFNNLEQQFTSASSPPKAVLVTGLPGLGKSSACLEYARGHCDHKIWMPAKNCEELLKSYHQFIQTQIPGLTYTEYLKPSLKQADQIVATMHQWLREHPNWVLVLDGIETFDDDLLWALPQDGQGQLLLNSCYLPPQTWVEKLPMAVMTMKKMTLDKAVLLLHALLPQLHNDGPFKEQQTKVTAIAEELAMRLDFSPLALVKFSGAVAEFQKKERTAVPLQDLLHFFTRNAWMFFQTPHTPQGFLLHRSLKQSFDGFIQHYLQEQAHNPEYQGALIQFCAFLHNENVPCALLQIWEKLRFPHGTGSLNMALESLNAADVLQWNQTTQTFGMSLHLQAAIRLGLRSTEAKFELENVYSVLRQAIEKDTFKNTPLIRLTKCFYEFHMPEKAKQLVNCLHRKTQEAARPLALSAVFVNMDKIWSCHPSALQETWKSLKELYNLKKIPVENRDYSPQKLFDTSLALWGRAPLENLYALIDDQENHGFTVGIIVSSTLDIPFSIRVLKDLFAERCPLLASRIIGKTEAPLSYLPMQQRPSSILCNSQIQQWLQRGKDRRGGIGICHVIDDPKQFVFDPLNNCQLEQVAQFALEAPWRGQAPAFVTHSQLGGSANFFKYVIQPMQSSMTPQVTQSPPLY